MHTAFIWTGQFASEKTLQDYANHSKRNCAWYKDFPFSDDVIATYDQSFRAPGETLRDALLRLHYSAEYLDAVVKKLKQQKQLDTVNAVKLMYAKKADAKLVDVQSWPQDKQLRFLGQFDFDLRKAPLQHPDLKTEPRYDHTGYVSIWIGTAKSPAQAEKYFAEDEYDEAADDGPSSPFGRDWRLSYDHDYLFYETATAPLPIAKLVAKWRDLKPFAAAIAAAAAKQCITDGNVIVVAYDLDYTQQPPFSTTNDAGYIRHPGKPKAKSIVKFLGAFHP